MPRHPSGQRPVGDLTRALLAAALLAISPSGAGAQREACPPPGWSLAQLEVLKKDGFKLADAAQRHRLALQLPACLGHPNPVLRDGVAFEALSSWMRSDQLDQPALRSLRRQLITMIASPDAEGFRAPFAALVLSEVARTDRVAAWMTTGERDEVVRVAALYLARIDDYRAFDDTQGFRHGVAHGADVAMQLALNPLITKAQLDHLMLAVASQVSPNADMAYWAGEPDRLARPIVFIAQRNVHSAAEWQAFFSAITNPQPLASWREAFASEAGLKKRHNVRAFLLSVYASANSSEDAGVRRLVAPVTAALESMQ